MRIFHVEVRCRVQQVINADESPSSKNKLFMARGRMAFPRDELFDCSTKLLFP